MKFFLHHFFQNETTDRSEKGLVNIPQDESQWPASWKTVVYKQYSWIKEINLPQVSGEFFQKFLLHRRSSAKYALGNKITERDLAYILKCGYGLEGSGETGRNHNRTVPSGGKRYPLEVYIFLWRQVGGLKPGIYHYNIRHHSLEPIVQSELSKNDISLLSPISWIPETNGMVCVTGVFERTVEKYGSRGYRYILLEAGHVGQNLVLAGTERKIDLVPLGGINESEIEKQLGLTGLHERVVYALSF